MRNKLFFALAIVLGLVSFFSSNLFAKDNITDLKESGDRYFDSGEYNNAIDEYVKVLKKSQSPKLSAYILYRIASSYEILKDYVKSANFYFKSIEINKEFLDYGVISILYFRLGNVLELSKRIDQSIIAFKNAFTSSKAIGNERIQAHSSYRLGLILYLNGNVDSSLRYFMVSLKYHTKHNNLSNAGIIAYYIGNIYYDNDRKEDAFKIWRISLKVLKDSGSEEWKIVEQTIKSLE